MLVKIELNILCDNFAVMSLGKPQGFG